MKINHSIFWSLILLILAACGNATYEGVIVTFRVADKEQYKIQITDPAEIEIARKLLAGEEGPKIPNGKVVLVIPVSMKAIPGILTLRL